MSWAFIILPAALGFVAGGFCGFFWGSGRAHADLTPMWRRELARRLRDSAQDRAGYLRALRRELANILMRRDPDRFLSFFRDVYKETKTIPHLKPERQNELLSALTSKHKYYKDFDIIGTRDHVLYADTAQTYADDDLEKHYRDIVVFQALQHEIDADWKWFPAVVEKDLSHCEEYVARVKDSRFRRRIQAAIQEWRVFQSAKENADRYESDVISVQQVQTLPFPEVSYGIHFKDTNEYGVYSFFVHDGSKVTTEYSRSNQAFETLRSVRNVEE